MKMSSFKNILFGFLVSFLGSLPLSYLNIVGVEIYSKSGMDPLVSYLAGVIAMQTVVVYLMVIFANMLRANKKLMKAIDFFAIFFLLLLSYFFYAYGGEGVKGNDYFDPYIRYYPFCIGVLLCALNFLQIPFWIIWNLYLAKGKYIVLVGDIKIWYILGTMLGTFWGMWVAILALDSIADNSLPVPDELVPTLLALFFLALALWQAFKVYKKSKII